MNGGRWRGRFALSLRAASGVSTGAEDERETGLLHADGCPAARVPTVLPVTDTGAAARPELAARFRKALSGAPAEKTGNAGNGKAVGSNRRASGGDRDGVSDRCGDPASEAGIKAA